MDATTTINKGLTSSQYLELLGAMIHALEPKQNDNIREGRQHRSGCFFKPAGDNEMYKHDCAGMQCANKKELPPTTGSSPKARQD